MLPAGHSFGIVKPQFCQAIVRTAETGRLSVVTGRRLDATGRRPVESSRRLMTTNRRPDADSREVSFIPCGLCRNSGRRTGCTERGACPRRGQGAVGLRDVETQYLLHLLPALSVFSGRTDNKADGRRAGNRQPNQWP